MRSPHCAALQAVIHSKHAFSYQEAQDRIDNAQDESPITNGLRQLNALAKALRRCGAAPCHICTGTARALQDCAVPTPHPARPPAASPGDAHYGGRTRCSRGTGCRKRVSKGALTLASPEVRSPSELSPYEHRR